MIPSSTRCDNPSSLDIGLHPDTSAARTLEKAVQGRLNGASCQTDPVSFLLLLAGAALLYFGAEWLVGGAARLAASMRVPQIVVGLTVVAYGTSAPEVIVGIQAALGGHGDVALGNVIGSNIANLGLILGAAVLLRPTRVRGELRRRELPVLLGSALLVPLVLLDGAVQRWEAAVLLVLAVAYTAWTVRTAGRGDVEEEAREGAALTAEAADAGGAPAPVARVRQALVALIGLAVLLVGGRLFVGAATTLALAWGMSERVVGLTIVAVGTSLPELATSLIAAARGHSDIAVGNVIGSNIFNVLLCLGTSAAVGRISSRPRDLIFDLGTLLAMTIVATVFMRTERTMLRWEGMVLLAMYAVFLAFVSVG
jgi:cation:H+ antiporter